MKRGKCLHPVVTLATASLALLGPLMLTSRLPYPRHVRKPHYGMQCFHLTAGVIHSLLQLKCSEYLIYMQDKAKAKGTQDGMRHKTWYQSTYILPV